MSKFVIAAILAALALIYGVAGYAVVTDLAGAQVWVIQHIESPFMPTLLPGIIASEAFLLLGFALSARHAFWRGVDVALFGALFTVAAIIFRMQDSGQSLFDKLTGGHWLLGVAGVCFVCAAITVFLFFRELALVAKRDESDGA